MNFTLPPLAGGYAYREIEAAAKGRPVNPLSRHGEPRTLRQAVLANVAGIRIRPIHVEEDPRRRIEEIAYEIRDIHPEMRRYGRSRWLTDDEKQEALKGQMERIRALAERAQRDDPTADMDGRCSCCA